MILPERRERGVALIIVLGIVALIAAWAMTAISEDQLLLRRAENMQASLSAMTAAESALELARLTLFEDAKNAADSDNLDELWAQETPPFPVDDGVVEGHIEDANRYYNLNDLVDAYGQVSAADFAIVQRLFQQAQVPVELADALADWMDADQSPRPGGAENSAYYDMDYHVKNVPLDRLEEILLIKGFDQAMLDQLRGLVVARPSLHPTKLNLNTASKEVLQAVLAECTPAQADGIIAERQAAPYTTLPAHSVTNSWATPANLARLAVTSDAFLVRAIARFDRATWGEQVLLERKDDKEAHIIYRERLGWRDLMRVPEKSVDTDGVGG